jgi:hypothetical protein
MSPALARLREELSAQGITIHDSGQSVESAARGGIRNDDLPGGHHWLAYHLSSAS